MSAVSAASVPLISYGETVGTAADEAFAQAKEYLADGITVPPLAADYSLPSDYRASNGLSVGIEWTQLVYDNTIEDEGGRYLISAYLNGNKIAARPKWFEGTKKLKVNVNLTAQYGGQTLTETAEANVVLAPSEPVPEFNVNDLGNYIDIGNPDSENGCFESVRSSDVRRRTVDGTVHTYRTLDKNGAMALTLRCDPGKTNYLTVKLWGGDTGEGMLWLCDPASGNMNISGNTQPKRNSLVDRRDWTELNFLSGSPQFDGGFIYSTYIIPEIYTKGKEYVSLRLYSTGGHADYSAPSIKEQTAPSRGIYAAYMTQSANFNPTDFEDIAGGHTESEPQKALPLSDQKALALEYAKYGVETFKSWQIYGGDNYPSYMEGMPTRTTGWKSKRLTDTDWKDAFYNTNNGMLKQNMTPLNMYEVFALAYKNAEELGLSEAEKAELLDRIIKGVDFLVRAQGANGGFFTRENKWIGGPDRAAAGGNNLTGFGLRSVAAGILYVYDDIAASGRLEGMIDSDASGQTDMKRKTAWGRMIAASRDYLVSLDGAGHAPNQDMANIVAALRFEMVLQLMNSEYSWKNQNKEADVAHLLDIGLGFDISAACSSYWVSPKGLILENFGSVQGGYAGDYGTEALEELTQLAELAEQYYGKNSVQAKKYTERMHQAFDSIDKFMFTENGSSGEAPKLYAEGLTGNRNAGYPGTERYITEYYAAAEQRNKTALKIYDLFFKHNRLQNSGDIYRAGNAHFEDNTLAVLNLYLNFDRITAALEEENTDGYSFFMEDEAVDGCAWADEMGRNVVIKNGEDKIYLALNWRNPMRSVDYYNTASSKDNQQVVMNNLARVHHTTGRYDKYGYAAMETEGWGVRTADRSPWQKLPNHYVEAFMYLNYGDYTVLMNSNNLLGAESGISYPIPWEKLGLSGCYKDLISGRYYCFGKVESGAIDGKTAVAGPALTMVLYKTEMPSAAVKSEYTDNHVTVSFNGSGAYGRVYVYAAEYSGDVLINVKAKQQTIENTGKIEFDYQRMRQDSEVKIFVWDENLAPLS